MLPIDSYSVFLKYGTWGFLTLQSVQSTNVRAMMPEYWLPRLEVSCSAGTTFFCRKTNRIQRGVKVLKVFWLLLLFKS